MKSSASEKRSAVILLLGCMIMNIVACGFGTQTRGLFMGVVTGETGIPRSVFSMTFSVVSLMLIPLTANISAVKRRLGTFRLVIAVGFVLEVVGLLIASQGTALWMFYLYAIGVQAGTFLCTTPTTTALINNWFTQNKATLLGALFAGTSLGGAIGIYLCGLWIDRWGWRTAYLISAGIMAVTGLLVIFMVRDHPKGKEPLEETPPSPAPAAKRASLFQNPMWRSRECLLLGTALFLINVTVQGLHVCSTMVFSHLGVSTVTAASISSRALLFATMGKIASGFLTDRIGVRKSRLFLVTASVVGMAAMLFGGSLLGQWAFIVFFGVGCSGAMMFLPMHTSACFKPEDTLDVFSVVSVFTALGNFLGAPMISLYFDLVGDYRGIIATCAALTALAGLIFGGIRPLSEREGTTKQAGA